MPTWKRTIFVNEIKTLMVEENKKAEEIITRYAKLTDTEKTELLVGINA